MENKKIKYITYSTIDNIKTGFIFPSEIDHDKMASQLRLHRTSIIGAGFCEFIYKPLLDNEDVLQIKCHGESISLNIKSTSDDSLILTKEYLGLGYVL